LKRPDTSGAIAPTWHNGIVSQVTPIAYIAVKRRVKISLLPESVIECQTVIDRFGAFFWMRRIGSKIFA
jgi:hypothetical protein